MNHGTTPRPNLQQAVPFFRVSNMQASLKFYREGLGFALKNTWAPRGTVEWCWLTRDNVAIMLQELRPEWVATHPPEGKLGIGMSIEFQCLDAIALYHEFTAKGLNPNEPCVGNGLWVTSITDPDGFCLGFESPTDMAEGTTYRAWLQLYTPQQNSIVDGPTVA